MKLDEIGLWSEIKLEILENYLVEYSKILSRQKDIYNYYYIDAFAGAGTHLKKDTGEEVKGSPRIALDVNPSFSHYFFIDWNKQKAEYLSEIVGDRKD
ncbi:MAG: three-Cys-motif partner protein TcmP, partial [Candidatus Zixiibacteriota bacterium]